MSCRSIDGVCLWHFSDLARSQDEVRCWSESGLRIGSDNGTCECVRRRATSCKRLLNEGEKEHNPLGRTPKSDRFRIVSASSRLSAEHSPVFRRAPGQRYRLSRHQTVRRSTPADRTQMQLRPRDFPEVGHEWGRKDRLKSYVESSSTRSADCQCHIEWPDASIRQLPKARHGPAFPKIERVAAASSSCRARSAKPKRSSVKNPSSRRGTSASRAALTAAKVLLERIVTCWTVIFSTDELLLTIGIPFLA